MRGRQVVAAKRFGIWLLLSALLIGLAFEVSWAAHFPHAQLGFAGPSGRLGVVAAGTSPLTLSAPAGIGGLAEYRIAYHIVDERGVEVEAGAHTLSLASGETSRPFGPAHLPPGLYRIEYTVHSDLLGAVAITGDEAIPLIVLPAVADSGARVHAQFGALLDRLPDGAERAMARLLQSLGIDTVWGVAPPRWRDVQWFAGGGIHWRSLPEERRAALEANLQRIAQVGRFPEWIPRVDPSAHTEPLALAERLSDYARYVNALAVHDAQGVSHFSALPPGALEALPPREAAAYIQIARLALDATAGGAGVGLVIEMEAGESEALERLLAEGVARHIDAIMIHWEEAPTEAEAREVERLLAELRSTLARHGGHAELWARSSAGTGAAGQREDWIEAAELGRSHLLFVHLGFDRIWSDWEALWDPVGTAAQSAQHGMPAVQPRASLAAYATLLHALEGHTYIGRLDSEDDVWLLLFAREGEPLLVGWTTRPQAVVDLNLYVESAQWFDLFGRSEKVEFPGGRLRLHLDGMPRFIRVEDASLIARALLDSGIDRLFAGVPSEDEAALEWARERLERAAIELWFAAERAFAERRAADEVGRGGNSRWTPVATDLGLGVLPEPDAAEAAVAWLEALSIYSHLLREAVAGDGTDGVVPYHAMAGLPLFVELGILVEAEDAGAEAIEVVIAGSAAVVDEARTWWDEQIEAVQQRYGGSERLLGVAEAWLLRAREAEGADAQAMWALAAREAAALAVLVAQTTAPPLSDGILLVEGELQLDLQRGMPALMDPVYGRSTSEAESRPTQLLRQALRPEGLLLPTWPPDSTASPHIVGSDGVEPLSVEPVEEVVWLTVELPSTVYRLLLRREAPWQVEVDAPVGWMWQTGLRTYAVGSEAAAEVPVAHQTGGVVEVRELDLRLLVPSDTPPGVYRVVVQVRDALGGRQTVPFELAIARGSETTLF